MNHVTWAIQTNLISDFTAQSVWEYAKRMGCDVHEAIVIPFQDDLDNQAELEALDSDESIIIPYGSVKLAKIASRCNWRGNCYVPETFKVDVWNHYRDDMLNHDAVFMRVRDTHDFLRGVPDDQQFFIRPLQDLKEFNGTVADAADIRHWMNSPKSGNFSFGEDTMIAISYVKKLYSESRWFVVDGKVIDGSYYRMGGRLIKNRINQPEVIAEAQRVADIWLPHECCVLDIADTDDGTKVIEFNTINSSGFYDHDIGSIVFAMTEWARKL